MQTSIQRFTSKIRELLLSTVLIKCLDFVNNIPQLKL